MKITDLHLQQAGVIDPRFGMIDILNCLETNITYMVKIQVFESIDHFTAAKSDSEARKALHHDNILDFIDYEIDEENMQIKSLFVYPGEPFQSENVHLSDINLYQLLNDMLAVLTYLQKKNIIHGDIRPSYLHYDVKNHRWILLDRLHDPSSPLEVQINNIQADNTLYMDPILFDALHDLELKGKTHTNALGIQYSPYKAESFALGMVLLDLYAHSQSIQACYNKSIGKFDDVLLETSIADLKTQFVHNELVSKILDLISKRMVISNKKNRLAPKKLFTILERDIKPVFEAVPKAEHDPQQRNSALDWGYGSSLNTPLIYNTESQFDVLRPTNVNEAAELRESNKRIPTEENIPDEPQLELSQHISQKIIIPNDDDMSFGEENNNDLAVQLKLSAAKNLNMQEIEYEFNYDSHNKDMELEEEIVIKRGNLSIATQPTEELQNIIKEIDNEKEFIFVDGHNASTVRNSREQSANPSTKILEHPELGTIELRPGNDEMLHLIDEGVETDPIVEKDEYVQTDNDFSEGINCENMSIDERNSLNRRSTTEFLKNIDEQIRMSEHYLNNNRNDVNAINPLSVKDDGGDLRKNTIHTENSELKLESYDKIINHQESQPTEPKISEENLTYNTSNEDYNDVPIQYSNIDSPTHLSIEDKMRIHASNHITKVNNKPDINSTIGSIIPTAQENPNQTSQFISRPNPLSVNLRNPQTNPYSSLNSQSNYQTLNFSKLGYDSIHMDANFQKTKNDVHNQQTNGKPFTYVSYRDLTVEKPHNSHLDDNESKNGLGVDVKDLILVRIENGVNIYRYREDINL